ncbi:hypothetical protein [Pedobacter gandavensis]|uniref:DUF5004 domain-containing protein n=1 Tax=Pedobacter gandavensis TaxID=2679963 RepID=A0ABR6F2M0_9SPHI|nr:hypothetical protein [Pedobacter gandavensis]MBB2151787.1 hypothetical protein [Pedobacter gandavensis]
MKKILLLLLCTATLGLASCKKEVIVDPGLPNETIETVIAPGNWTYINNNETLTTTVQFPEIDPATFKNDALIVALYPDNSVAEYKGMPFTYNGLAYSYTVRRGSITVEIETSGDNNLTPTRPVVPVGLRVTFVTSTLR